MTQFSARIDNLHASPIREILAVINQPGMISFAGGLPSTECFPDLKIGNIPQKYLQYGTSEGDTELRVEIQSFLQKNGLDCTQQQIIILSGSQQGIDLVAKLFIDPGTCVALEYPTYLAALQVFRFFGAKFAELNQHNLLSRQLQPSLAYTIPTFQNPTAYCYNKQERQDLARNCDQAGVTLFEDDPYRELVYEQSDRTIICSLLKKSNWIYQSSFSKCLAPGLRLGFLVCSPQLIQPITRLKQAADLHSSRLSQWLVLKQLQNPDYANYLNTLVESYRNKRNRFAKLLDQHMKQHACWQLPKGGLFFWLKLHQAINTKELLNQAIKANVAFMPGEDFFPYPQTENSFLRLNFSHTSEKEAERGLKTLASLLNK